jgi:hypothetical protein
MEPFAAVRTREIYRSPKLFKGFLGANGASLTFCGFDDVIAALTTWISRLPRPSKRLIHLER